MLLGVLPDSNETKVIFCQKFGGWHNSSSYLRVGMAAAVAAVADNARMSCRHEQANRFCKLKSGKLKRRRNANLFERVCTIIWCGFLFHIPFSTGFTRA